MNKLFGKSQRLIVVSNRLPFTIVKKDGEVYFKESSGGLVTGLTSFLDSWDNDYIWIGWPGAVPSEADRQELRRKAMGRYCAYPVFLPEDIAALSALVKAGGLSEDEKTDDRTKLAGRIRLLHDVIQAGLNNLKSETVRK